MWDISNTTTWIKGNHTLNIGANYRRWWLQRDLATDFTGNFGFGAGFNLTGSPVADFLLGYYTSASSFQPAGFSVPGQVGNPREMNFMYFAPYIQDDWKVSSEAHPEPGPALRLPQRALRDERPHGLAKPELRPGRPARGGPDAGVGGNQRRPVLPGGRPPEPRESRPLQRLRSPHRLRLPPGRRREDRHPRRLRDASTTRPRAARSTARRTSTPTSAGASIHSR